ncbi:MAG: DUF4956 domain-containing protein [Clostridiales bacterium]|nr:MAG: DUF4956 domain-containing protein [Clostridiales bacterium]HJA30378.1 DUF4956 domain-containing protein [Candidatus Eisenbergiella pullicola]
MGFGDIFKNSFMEGFYSTDISLATILLSMAIVCLIALYIFFAYRLLTRRTFYNKNFGISLAALAIITAAIILTIQSSIVISLGMVGALSIVRFRTAIKEPMDLVFLFWSISVGIICGAGLYSLAIIASLIVTVALLVLDLIPVTKAPMLLIVGTTDLDGEDALLNVVKKYSKHYRVKSRNISSGRMDMIVEVRVREEAALVREACALKGMDSVSLLSHDGETTY